MKTVGLTGSTGAGKGYISEKLMKMGIPSLDCDRVCHDVYRAGEKCNRELCAYFGDGILAENGDIDRKKLKSVAFATEEGYGKLNEIAHAAVREKTVEWLAEQEKLGYGAAIVDAPLLFESGFDKLCDVIVSVVADRETQIKRVMKRDGIDAGEALSRLEKQKENLWYMKNSDFTADNSEANAENVADAIKMLYKFLTE